MENVRRVNGDIKVEVDVESEVVVNRDVRGRRRVVVNSVRCGWDWGERMVRLLNVRDSEAGLEG